MFNSKKIKKLEEKIEVLENKLFEVQYPNGRFVQELCMCGINTYFKYAYRGKTYIIDDFSPDVDYSKTDKGFVFVNKDRDKAWFLEFGKERAVEIPYPCSHD